MTIEEQIAKIEKTINEEYADISEYKELIRKQTAKEILNKVGNIVIVDDYRDTFCVKDMGEFIKITKEYGIGE